MRETIMVRCGSCGTLNRVDADKAGVPARCGECRAEISPGVPVEVTDGNFDERVNRSKRPVLLEFWSPSCGHCIRMGPVLDELAVEMAGRLLVAKLDITKNPVSSSKFEIQATPAFVLMQGGKERLRVMGAMPKDELMEKVRRFV